MTVGQHSGAVTTSESAPARASDVRGGWRGDIQGLRAIAVLMVVAYHSGLPVDGGFVGVDVFFVISGFVISGMLLRELQNGGRIRFARFYARRVRRLLPALATVTVVTLTLSALVISPLGPGQPSTGRAASAASVFFANGYFAIYTGGYFQPTTDTNPFLHTWSLSVEEQFYVVFPLSLFVVWRLVKGRMRPLVATTMLFVAVSLWAGLAFTYGWLPNVPGLHTLSTRPDLAERFAFYSPVTRAWEFLAGVAVSLLAQRRQVSSAVALVLAPAGLALMITSAFVVSASSPFPGWRASLPVIGTAAVIASGSKAVPSLTSRLLGLRPLVKLGDWSYSWYLWHWPAIVLIRVEHPTDKLWSALAGFGALIPAIACYHYIEQPVRRRSRRTPPRAALLVAAVCIGVPALAGGALTAAASHSWWNTRIARVEATVRPDHVDLQTGCASTYPLGDPLRPPCSWHVADSRGTVLLIGDSNAGHISEPVIAAAQRLHLDVHVATSGGCPFLLQRQYPTAGCAALVKADLAYIEAQPKPYEAIIVSNSAGLLNLQTGSARQRAIATWAQDLQTTTQRLTPQGPVINVGPIPQFPDIPNCIIPSVVSRGMSAGCGHLDREQAERAHGSIVAAERRALGVGARFVDLGSLICGADGCDVYRGEQLMYRDGAHLSVAGSMLYEPAIESLLRQTVSP